MTSLTVTEIITLHSKLIAVTGGSVGLRSRGQFASAVMNCYQTFGGEELYHGLIEKAVHLAFGISANHPFIDGNKRISVTLLLSVLHLNDVALLYTQKKLVAFGLGLAEGSLDN